MLLKVYKGLLSLNELEKKKKSRGKEKSEWRTGFGIWQNGKRRLCRETISRSQRERDTVHKLVTASEDNGGCEGARGGGHNGAT